MSYKEFSDLVIHEASSSDDFEDPLKGLDTETLSTMMNRMHALQDCMDELGVRVEWEPKRFTWKDDVAITLTDENETAQLALTMFGFQWFRGGAKAWKEALSKSHPVLNLEAETDLWTKKICV